MGILDNDPKDGVVSFEEFSRDSLIKGLLAQDIVYRGSSAASIGVKVHLRECAAGTCQAPRASCFNRVLDGDETDTDCGGSCGATCGENATCSVFSDCQSRGCDAGVCGRPTCQ